MRNNPKKYHQSQCSDEDSIPKKMHPHTHHSDIAVSQKVDGAPSIITIFRKSSTNIVASRSSIDVERANLLAKQLWCTSSLTDTYCFTQPQEDQIPELQVTVTSATAECAHKKQEQKQHPQQPMPNPQNGQYRNHNTPKSPNDEMKTPKATAPKNVVNWQYTRVETPASTVTQVSVTKETGKDPNMKEHLFSFNKGQEHPNNMHYGSCVSCPPMYGYNYCNMPPSGSVYNYPYYDYQNNCHVHYHHQPQWNCMGYF